MQIQQIKNQSKKKKKKKELHVLIFNGLLLLPHVWHKCIIHARQCFICMEVIFLNKKMIGTCAYYRYNMDAHMVKSSCFKSSCFNLVGIKLLMSVT